MAVSSFLGSAGFFGTSVDAGTDGCVRSGGGGLEGFGDGLGRPGGRVRLVWPRAVDGIGHGVLGRSVVGGWVGSTFWFKGRDKIGSVSMEVASLVRTLFPLLSVSWVILFVGWMLTFFFFLRASVRSRFGLLFVPTLAYFKLGSFILINLLVMYVEGLGYFDAAQLQLAEVVTGGL